MSTHTIISEYDVVFEKYIHNYKATHYLIIYILHRDTLAIYEELSIQEEYTIFATEDYLALLVEWEEYQRQPKPYSNLRPPLVESISPARKEVIIDAIKLDRRYSQRITYRLDILMTLVSTPVFDHIRTSCINLRDVIDQQAEMTEATMTMIDLAYNTRSLLETVTAYKNNAINGEALTASQRDRIESILCKTKSPTDSNNNNNNNISSSSGNSSDTADETTDNINININVIRKDAPRTKEKKDARDKKNVPSTSSKQQQQKQQQSNTTNTKGNASTNANGKASNTKGTGQQQQQQHQAPSSSSSRNKVADPPAGDDTIKLNILREDLIRNRNAALEMKAHAERLQTLMMEGKSAAARANAAHAAKHQPIPPVRPAPSGHTFTPGGNQAAAAAVPPIDPVNQLVEPAAPIPGGAGAAAAVVVPAAGNEGIPISFVVTGTILSFVYVFIFIIFIVVIPAHVGRYITSLWFYSSGDYNNNYNYNNDNEAVKNYIFSSINKGNSAILFMKLFDIPEIDELTATMKLHHQVDGHVIPDELYSKLRAMFEVSVGYSFYLTTFFAIYISVCVFCASQNTRNNFYQNQVSELLKVQFDVAIRTINTIIKGKLLLILYGILIPFASTSLILKFLSRRLPVEMQFTTTTTTTTTTYGNGNDDGNVNSVGVRGVTMTSSHVLVMVTLFLFSHLIMVHSRYIAFVLRQLVDKKYLTGFLPEVTISNNDNDTCCESIYIML